MIDLHLHSIFSDGSFTPEALAETAAGAGLSAIALTDHDCTAGLARFEAGCAGAGVRGITGVEISADVAVGTMHMLGYFIDAAHDRLNALLAEVREGRERRNARILERLNGLGLALAWDEVTAYAGDEIVSRSHFAQALEDKGYVSSRQAAFDRYLAKGKPGYVDRYRMTPEGGIGAIVEAGGVPVLAHPYTLELNAGALRAYLQELKAHGLQGIEVYYPEHNAERVRRYRKLAEDLDLVATGGTDFHGAATPHLRMGVGFGSLRVPDEIVPALERRRV